MNSSQNFVPNATPNGTASLLTVRGLRKQFGTTLALDGIDFSLAQGEFLTLLGPSGSGKTTTLMAIAGFVAPTAGDIQHKRVSIVHRPPEARGFGMVFQGYALFPHMTVAQNVCFPLVVRGVSGGSARARVHQALARVQLAAYAQRYPRQLSGGQQQRVALARALVYEPEILLLDEPLSALDKKLRGELQWELRRLHKESGASFLYVTHDQEEALSMSDRIAIFNQGRIVQIGTPVELYERPANLFVAQFLGRSNVLDGAVRAVAAGTLVVDVEGVVLTTVYDGPSRRVGDKVSLVVRPHQLCMVSEGETGLAAVVEAVSYAGNLINYLLRTQVGTPLYVERIAAQGGEPEVAAGTRVTVMLDAQRVGVLDPG